MNEDIGRGDCPVCGADAALRASKKGKAYMVCSGCGSQVFSRGPASDALLRSRKKAVAVSLGHSASASEPAAIQPPSGQPKKAQAVRRIHSADGGTVEVPHEPEKAAPAEEKTIFDYFLRG